jgi:hypothetical protein
VSVAPEAIAAEAGLRHVDAAALTIRRRRRGRGFSYVGSRGGRVDAAKRRWIESLALPPAWNDVRISADPDCHLLATGVDDAGRRQYRYHPGFRQVADDVKFARIAELGARISDVRTAVADAIASGDEHLQLTGIVVYWRAMAMRRRSSGSMKWSWSSVPTSSCTQWILPVNRLRGRRVVGRHRRARLVADVGGLVGGEDHRLGRLDPSAADGLTVVVDRHVTALGQATAVVGELDAHLVLAARDRLVGHGGELVDAEDVVHELGVSVLGVDGPSAEAAALGDQHAVRLTPSGTSISAVTRTIGS